MRNKVKIALLGIFLSVLSACGFQFKTGELLPPELRTMKFETGDKYSDMARVMRQTLRLNAIQLVDKDTKDVPIFYLDGMTESSDVSALFLTGKEAEQLLVVKANARIIMPNGESYPLSTQVVHNFFDSPQEALAKTTQKDVLWKQMQRQAAEQLINRLMVLKDKLKPSLVVNKVEK